MRTIALLSLAMVAGCEANPKQSDEISVDNPTLEEEAEIMLKMFRSEGLRFSPANLHEEQTGAMFEGRGDRTFWFAAAGCLGAYWTEVGSHIAYVTVPSENSDLFTERSSDWNDSDAIACFQSSSEDDFYVSRVPNFAAVSGETILPESE
ncbi:hypothetical protein [Erythrobacter alti]|uniref:hypothetical protein n=1 Tax=Erythrobacter alti TaxID=1896145 RepID=UPI0030F4671B